jgi:hypothetical protein
MDPKALARIERTNYALTAILVAFGAVVLGRPYALGLGVGALLSSLNFSLIRKLIDRQLAGARGQTEIGAATPRRTHAGILFIPKMAALIGVVFLAIRFLPMSAAAFAIGFSTFLVSIAIESVRFARVQPEARGSGSESSHG